jgi:hypothetical protein
MPGEDPTALTRPDQVAPDIAALCDEAETRHGEVVAYARASVAA